jgi:hypothetical protein
VERVNNTSDEFNGILPRIKFTIEEEFDKKFDFWIYPIQRHIINYN